MTSVAHERHVATGKRSLYCSWCGTWPPEADLDLVDPPDDLYIQPEVRALTDIICDSIHREVCETNVVTADGHGVGGAHQACEWNARHGGAAWLLMGMPRFKR